MNKIQIAVDAVLVAAIVVLFVIVCGSKSNKGATPTAPVTENVMPIAYLNLDSVLTNYIFAQEAGEKLMKKQEDARVKLNSKVRTFQNEAADFQRKVDNHAFLSQERAEKEAARLQQKQQELQELEAKLTQEIMIENQNLNMQLADTLTNFLQEFNADGRYHMILANTSKDNVLMASETYNITNEVIEALNARYAK